MSRGEREKEMKERRRKGVMGRKLQTRGSNHINNLNISHVSLFLYLFITPLCVFFFLAPKFTLLLFFEKNLIWEDLD